MKLTMTPALKTILAMTFPNYAGRKYHLEYARELTLYDRDWSGGIHADYVILRDIGNGIERAETPPFRPSAGPAAYAPTLALQPGYVVARHYYFCGRDAGITLFVNPDSKLNFLPEQASRLLA